MNVMKYRRCMVCLTMGLVLTLASCGKRPTPPKESLEEALKKGDRAKLESLIKQGAKVNEPNSKGRTPLHLAAYQGRLPVVKFLLENGADQTARTPDGMTPLHVAAMKGHLEVAELLVKSGSDVNALDLKGETPIDLGATEKIKVLLRTYGGKAGAQLK